MKNAKAQIPAPVMTPPASAQTVGVLNKAAPDIEPPSMKVTAAGIEFVRPEIKLRESVWSEEKRDQVYILTPKRALVIHGMLVIEEMRLALSLEGVKIRS